MIMRKAQVNSEIIKWILMIIILAIVLLVILMLQQGLPEAVANIIDKVGAIF